MQTKVLFTSAVLAFLLMSGCDDDTTSTTPETTLFETNGSWDCSVSESCQDVYEIDLKVGASVSLELSEVTGSSVLRLGIYAPGILLGGTNLLTGNSNEEECTGQDEGLIRNFVATSSGTYQLAITRDWGSSAGFSGTYHLKLFSDQGIDVGSQTVEDLDTQAPGSECL